MCIMAWLDDLLSAQYTDPRGKTFNFLYTDVEKETDLKTSTFTFPSKDGALVQSLGRGGRRFPLTCLFSGPDCIAEADAFEIALETRGIGELQHPVYGTRKVVPTGSIKRSDNIVTGSNIATVSITFAETITDEAMPDSAIAKSEEIEEECNAVENEICETFANEIQITDASEQIKLVSTLQENSNVSYAAMKNIAQENLCNTASAISGVQAKKNEAAWETFQTLKAQTNSLAAEITISNKSASKSFAVSLYATFKLPSINISNPLKTINAYSGASANIKLAFNVDPVRKTSIKNQFYSTFLSLTAAVSSTARAAMNAASNTDTQKGTGFKNREEAIQAMAQLEELFDNYIDYANSYDAKNIFVDTSDVLYNMQKLVIDTSWYVLDTAFNLPSRRTIVLGRDRQLLELLAELYGGFDRIDEFIQENNLNADELEMLPMGREVSYYVI